MLDSFSFTMRLTTFFGRSQCVSGAAAAMGERLKEKDQTELNGQHLAVFKHTRDDMINCKQQEAGVSSMVLHELLHFQTISPTGIPLKPTDRPAQAP